MIDPAAIGASVIIDLAFSEFAKTGDGEAAKATVAGAVELVKGLRDRIRARFHSNERSADAIGLCTGFYNIILLP